ncbi:hypothetical protein FKP32DRAFT_1578130, partial [Trametes sanguinea]
MLFPCIRATNGAPALTQTDLADLYDQGILPAVRVCCPDRVAHWPPSYQVAFKQSQDRNGRLHFHSIDIPEHLISQFVRELRRALADHPHLRDFWFMVELRGTKGMYSFQLGDAANRREVWNLLVEQIDITAEAADDNMQNWYCDIGLEVARPGHVVQWRLDAHARILRAALPKTTPNVLDSMMNGPQYIEDTSCLLYDLAGFRASPGRLSRKKDQVAHVNVYTTDKSVTYQLHPGAFRAHNPTDLYPGKIKALLRDVGTIASAFNQCSGTFGLAQDGTARYEVRVPLMQAIEAVPEMQWDTIRLAAVCIPNEVYWEYKFLRVAAIHYFLQEFATYPADVRSELNTLQMGVTVIWMLNGTITRPSDWASYVAVTEASALHI